MSIQGHPNLLLIIADDLGQDLTNVTGAGASRAMEVVTNDGVTDIVGQMQTVSLLLRNGINFAQAWAQPACSPTRASIYAGLHPWKSGVGSPMGYPTLGPAIQFTTIPELLPDDYECGLFGKWHLGDSPTSWPTAHGWDRHIGTLDGTIGNDYENWDKYDSDDYVPNPGTHTANYTVYATRDTVEEAGAWIDALPASTPWFVTLAFHTPHSPYHDPPGGFDPSTPGDPASQDRQFNLMVQNMDSNIGRLLGTVANPPIDAIPKPQLRNTLIVFIGDNGSHQPVAREEWKMQIYEGGLRVPMIVADGEAVVHEIDGNPASPRFLDPGKLNVTSPQLVHVVDLYKTLVRAADATATFPIETDSKDLSRIFSLPGRQPPVRRFNFSQWYTQGETRATIRNRRYKLNYDAQLQPDTWGLYEYSGGEVPGLEEDTATDVFDDALNGVDLVAQDHLNELLDELLASYQGNETTAFPDPR